MPPDRSVGESSARVFRRRGCVGRWIPATGWCCIRLESSREFELDDGEVGSGLEPFASEMPEEGLDGFLGRWGATGTGTSRPSIFDPGSAPMVTRTVGLRRQFTCAAAAASDVMGRGIDVSPRNRVYVARPQ